MKQKKTTRTSGTTPQSEEQQQKAAEDIARASEEKGTIAIMNKIARGETVVTSTSATIGVASKSKTLRHTKSPERNNPSTSKTTGGGELGDGPRRAKTGWKKGIGARTAPSLQRSLSATQTISAGIEGPVLAAFAYMEKFPLPGPHSRQNSTSSSTSSSDVSPGLVLDSNSASPLPSPPATPGGTPIPQATTPGGTPVTLPDQSLRRLRATTELAKPVTRARPGSRAEGVPFAPGSGAQAAMITGGAPVTRARASAADYNPPSPDPSGNDSNSNSGTLRRPPPPPPTLQSATTDSITGGSEQPKRLPVPPRRGGVIDNHHPELTRAATTGSLSGRPSHQTVAVRGEKRPPPSLPLFDSNGEAVTSPLSSSPEPSEPDEPYHSSADDVMSGPLVLQTIPPFRAAGVPPPPPPRRNVGIAPNVPGSGAAHTAGAEDEPWSDPLQSRQRSATAAATTRAIPPPPPRPQTLAAIAAAKQASSSSATGASPTSTGPSSSPSPSPTSDNDSSRSVRFDTAANTSWESQPTRQRGHSASLLPASVAKGSPSQSPTTGTHAPQFRSFRRRTPSQDASDPTFTDALAAMQSRPRSHTRAHTRAKSELP
jgi:hypothetical protein